VNRFRCSLAVIAIMLAFLLPIASCRAQSDGGPQKAGWRLTFDDEF